MPDQPSMLAGLVGYADMIADAARSTLAPVASARGNLRGHLEQTGRIVPVAVPDDAARPESMCAVDGGRVTERLFAADLIAAVACTADGRFVQNTLEGPHAEWSGLFSHMPDVDRIAGSAMAALELQVLAQTPHQVRLVDGSFLTPSVEFRKGLASKEAFVRNKVADLIGQYDVIDRLRAVLTPNSDRPIYALPKSETSTWWRKKIGEELAVDLPVTDRVFAAQVLRPGEMLVPRALEEWGSGFVRPDRDASRAVQQAAEALYEVSEQARGYAAQGRLMTSYLRPPRGVGVLRVEFFLDTADDLAQAQRIAGLISAETQAPHMMEPFAQWAVDRKAKDVSGGVRALKAAVAKRFSADEQTHWGGLFTSGYRST